RERELHLLHRAVENSVNGVFIVDAAQSNTPVIYSNATLLKLTGYPREEMIGRNFLQIRGPDTSAEAITRVQQAVSEGAEVQVPLLSYRRDGTSFWSELYVSPIREDGQSKHFVGVLHDISAQKDYEARLAYYASHDLLTGLPNRQSFETQLEESMDLARRRGETLAVLSVDIDDFRPINDSLGHTTGDRLLVAIAERLESVLHPDSMLARLGGDEFVVLVPQVTNQERVIALAESILDALTQLYVVDDHRLQVSGSVGIAAGERPLKAPGDLIHQANQAMLGAKQRGRNTWEWHAGAITPQITERVTLRRELEEAIRREEFELYYQPVVDAGTRRVQSFEALVRWRHPERGLLAPDRFIALAEQTGQIVSLGRLVLRQAAHDMAELERTTGSVLPVAVNISPLQFRRETFLDDVHQALDLYGMAPQRLTIELTEGVLMHDTDSAIATLEELNRMGIKVAIDDFGTGFSSLSYLRQLTISTVKLDGSFIRDILTDRSSGAVVQGTITMAHHMDLAVVAERVETAAQASDLQRRGCNLLQGFLFARPVPRTELRTYLEQPVVRRGQP
ncbi:MAG: EAL domain-containing protein, partial [Ectothiorhodospiraceae bacterium]